MAKDFTDYILMVLDSGDRVYHQVHLRHQKGKLYNPELVDFKTAVPHGTSFIAQPVNGHKYLLNLDRAYRVKWAPWKKVLVRPAVKIKFKKKGIEYVRVKKPLFPLKVYATLKELVRSKKVGLLIYQEPNPPITVEDKVPVKWFCSACDFETDSASGIKVHISAKHKDATIKPPGVLNKIEKRVIRAAEPIEPMHISRIHQPSGVMKG